MRYPDIISQGNCQPTAEMKRLREMLDAEGIEWQDASDEIVCRTQLWDGDCCVYSAVRSRYIYGTYGEIELWTRSMRERKEDHIGLDSAEEAMELIRKEVGK